MPLPQVAAGQQHVKAHNDERTSINQLESLVGAGGRLSEAKLADTFALDQQPVLTGTTMTVYGDSFGAGYGLANGVPFTDKVAAAEGMVEVNHAVSGSAGQTIAHLMLDAGNVREWISRSSGILLICAGLNDSRYRDLTDPANVAWVRAYEHSIRIAAALGRGKPRVFYGDPSWSFNGAWSNEGYPWASYVAVARTTVKGAGATITFEGDEITLIIGGFQDESTAVADYFIDGKLVRTTRFHDDVVTYPSSTTTVGWTAERFTGLGPGKHTLRFVKADDQGGSLFVDSYILPRTDSAPQVLLVKEPLLDPSEYTRAEYAPYNVGSQDSTRVIWGVLERIAADFPGVRTVDVAPFDYPADYLADGIHPNATTGTEKMRAALQKAVDPQQIPVRVRDETSNQKRTGMVVAQFTTPGVHQPYDIPDGAVALRVRVLAGGGGGGSGRRGAAGTVRCGGGGGAGGGYADVTLPTYGLPPRLYVSVGAGGAGGASQTADDTSGNAGSPGVASFVSTTTTIGADESIFVANAPRGAAGSAGTAASGVGGATGASRDGLSGNGGSASTTGGIGGTTTTNGYGGVGQGGGAGGGITSGNGASAGGNGWFSNQFLTGTLTAPQGGGPTGGGGAPGYPANRLPGRLDSEGSGAGGGANLTGPGGSGGGGGRGSGGGGGGASVNGNPSGAGGAGGDGYVEITAYF